MEKAFDTGISLGLRLAVFPNPSTSVSQSLPYSLSRPILIELVYFSSLSENSESSAITRSFPPAWPHSSSWF